MNVFRFPRSFDPVADLLRLQQDIDRMFENPFGLNLGVSGRGVFPAVNIFQDTAGYVARLEVPGVVPDTLRVEAHGQVLAVSGKRELQAPAGGSFHRRERSGGEFARSIQLPDDLDVAKAEASYRHGVLTVRIPKRTEAQPRQINVQTV
jgi:HSP20 family protein